MSTILHTVNYLLTAIALLSPKSALAVTQIPSHAYVQVETDAKNITWPWRVFKSSAYTPPNMTITGNGGALAPGFVFMTPQGIIDSSHPTAEESAGFIMTDTNEMVFCVNVTGLTDFRVQDVYGEPHLTYWSGYSTTQANIGHGYGQVNFVDSTYKSFMLDPNLHLVKLATTPNPKWSIDLHEHQMTTSGDTIVVTAYNNTPYDLSPYGGPKDGWLADAQIYELDVKTGKILFKWTSSDHVPLSESHQPISANNTKAEPWDWFHVNAAEKVGNDYLINGRHVWSTYYVSGSDGNVVWRIEGENGGDFGKIPKKGNFRWQHDARLHNITDKTVELSIFDNHNAAQQVTNTPSNGLVFLLELPAKKSYTPKLLRRIETPSDPIFADSQGSYNPSLSNGNQLLGYGQISVTREYGPGSTGKDLRWQAQFGAYNAVQSYRAFKMPWKATPAAWDPSLVVENGFAYVSWNGATEVTQWNVYTDGSKVAKAYATKQGFETVFKVPSGAKTVQVGAVEGSKLVRKSNVAKV